MILAKYKDQVIIISMNGPDISVILADLAAGRIDATEAGRLIDAAEHSEADNKTDSVRQTTARSKSESESSTSKRSGSGNQGITKVAIVAVGRRVRLVGDSTVATVSVEGPHVLRRTNSVLNVASTGEVGPSFDGFSLIRPPRNLDDLRNIGLGKELIVKVNPAIEVDVEITTGGLNSKGIPHFGRVRGTAGGVELNEVTEVTDLLIQAGTATVSGPISQGRSRMRVESGSLTIRLAKGSNVTVSGTCRLGRLSWPGEHTDLVDELVVGNGSANLEVEVVMGMASIREEN